jgi:hypothetical protein
MEYVIADGTCALDATFYCGKGVWSKDRHKAKIFETCAEAQEVASKLDSNIWEVEVLHDGFRPFTVKAWAK